MNKATKDESGFSLVELVVVSVLLSLIALVLYGSLNGIMQGKTLIESKRNIHKKVESALEQIVKDLSARTIIALSNQDPNNTTKSYFEGKNGETSEIEEDSIRFVTLASNLNGVTPAEVEYRLEPIKEEESTSLKKLGLVREEIPASVTDEEIIKAHLRVSTLISDAALLKFRYLKNGVWQNTWNNSHGALPEAIEITIGVKSEEGKAETFRTAIAISKRS